MLLGVDENVSGPGTFGKVVAFCLGCPVARTSPFALVLSLCVFAMLNVFFHVLIWPERADKRLGRIVVLVHAVSCGADVSCDTLSRKSRSPAVPPHRTVLHPLNQSHLPHLPLNQSRQIIPNPS